MNFDSYYFTMVSFEDVSTGEEFIVNFAKEDMFYKELLPFMLKGKAEGMEELRIETLCIPTVTYKDIKKKTFHMTANAVFSKKQDNNKANYYPGAVTIERICIDNIDPRYVEQKGDKTIIKNCNLVLQCQTKVEGVYDMGDE